LAVELAPQFTQNSNALESNEGNLMPEKLDSTVLLHELQLGGQLNTSVVETRRADFSLMLAMLTDDVREQSQFILPKTPISDTVEHNNDLMRKAFNLPEKASLALSSLDDITQFNQAQAIVDNNLISIQLSNAMNPKPLAFRNNTKHISTEIIENTSLFTQLKHKQSQAIQVLSLQETNQAAMSDPDKPLNQSLTFNAKAWLEGIQQSSMKTTLVN